MLTNTGFKGLTQDLQEMAAALREFIQQEDPVMRQRHFSRRRDRRRRHLDGGGRDSFAPQACASSTAEVTAWSEDSEKSVGVTRWRIPWA